MDWLHKSSIEEIRQRFDGDVERFANLETGQSAPWMHLWPWS